MKLTKTQAERLDKTNSYEAVAVELGVTVEEVKEAYLEYLFRGGS